VAAPLTRDPSATLEYRGPRLLADIHTFEATLPHGIGLSCRSVGSAGPSVLFLHGFPEGAFAWDEVMLRLAREEPVRALAPNLRGFERSTAPKDVEQYRAKHLVADVEALIAQQLGGCVDLLVAHDWGGAVAWGLAALRPQLMKHLLIINSPHPATFLRELRDNPAQQQASAYMNFLCRPDAQALLSENDFARLWPFFENMGGQAWLTPELRQRYRELWQHGLEGGLNYYRASPLKPSKELQDLQLPDALTRVNVPTTVLWGERDRALLPWLPEGLEQWVPRLQVHRVPQASHWVVHEMPEVVVGVMRGILRGSVIARRP